MAELTPGERRAFLAAMVTASLAIAQQVAARATRDALFLGRYEARQLPLAMLLGAVASLITAGLFSRWAAARGPQRIAPSAFAISALLFLLEWLLVSSRPEVAIWMLYTHLAAFGAVLISGFWSIFNEQFNPNTAKRLIGKIGAGATLGGVIGGVAAARVSEAFEVRSTLLLLMALNLACAGGSFRLGRALANRPPVDPSRVSGLRELRQSPYLVRLGLLVATTAFASALVDFALKATADVELEGEQALLGFFAAFYSLTSLVTFLVQSLFAKRALAKLGLTSTLALLPAGLLAMSVLGAAVTRLWSLTVLRGVGSVLENSLYRSSYELLYTPIAAPTKRATKAIIDVAFDRIGDALGSLAVLVAVSLLPLLAPKIAVGLAALVALVALTTAWRIHSGYVQALADSLRSGVVALSSVDIQDATTRKTLADTTMALDRERLLVEIAKLRGEESESERPEGRASSPPVSRRSSDLERLSPAFVVLIGNDPAAIKQVLHGELPLTPEFGPLIIRLLGQRDLRRDAQRVLIQLGPHIVGQLHDVLLDADRSLTIRRHIPSVLQTIDSRRAADALNDALDDAQFEIRYRAVQALVALGSAHPTSVTPSEARITTLVLRELEDDVLLDDRSAAPPSQGSTADKASKWLDDVVRKQVQRKLDHVFTLLGLSYGASSMKLCQRALSSPDPNLRGTALEYLDSVLPSAVRVALWSRLGMSRTAGERERTKQEILEDLLRSVGA